MSNDRYVSLTKRVGIWKTREKGKPPSTLIYRKEGAKYFALLQSRKKVLHTQNGEELMVLCGADDYSFTSTTFAFDAL